MRPGRIRPGKPDVGIRTSRLRSASMRPGRIRPGKRLARPVRPRGPCPRFNEAGANPPRKAARPSFAGSHRGACFNEAGANPPRKDRSQSMGRRPRPRASMRPGRIRPGKVVREVMDEYLIRLLQ